MFWYCSHVVYLVELIEASMHVASFFRKKYVVLEHFNMWGGLLTARDGGHMYKFT